jgi:hypothetical protein
MWNNFVTWIRANWRPALSWLRNNIRLVAIAAAILFLLVSYWGCSSAPSSTSPAPGSGWLFLKLAFAGLIWAAYASRERTYLAVTFSGLAVLVFLVLLGKFDGLFVWAILGLPLFAAAGIYGATKTEGRTKSFLGFASGVIILMWLYMFAKATLKVDLGFLGNRITDEVNLIIGLLAVGIFAFAAWRRNWIFFLISFAVLAAWLGPDVSNRIQERFPSQLSASDKTKGTWEEIWDSLLNKVKQAVKPDPTSEKARATAPPPKVAAPKKELRHYTKSFPLQFLGAENIVSRGPGWVKIKKDRGRANFLVANIPLVKDARYEIVFHAAREKTGKTFLKVNHREFCYNNHLSSDAPVEIAFFRQGEAGNSERFLPRENALQLWADNDLLVQLDQPPYVKMTYLE